jgi:hypothetical protein
MPRSGNDGVGQPLAISSWQLAFVIGSGENAATFRDIFCEESIATKAKKQSAV